jgi:hypothetical protein
MMSLWETFPAQDRTHPLMTDIAQHYYRGRRRADGESNFTYGPGGSESSFLTSSIKPSKYHCAGSRARRQSGKLCRFFKARAKSLSISPSSSIALRGTAAESNIQAAMIDAFHSTPHCVYALPSSSASDVSGSASAVARRFSRMTKKASASRWYAWIF